MGRKIKAFKNILWGFISRIVMVVTPFLTRTVLIYTLGIEYEGIKGLFTSLLQVLSFAELGIGSAMVFSMYRPAAEKDDERICALLNLYRRTYRIIGIVIVTAGLILLPFLRIFIAGDIPEDVNIFEVFIIYLFNNAIGYFLFSYQSAVFMAYQRVDVLSKINTAIQFILHFFQIVALITLKNYYAYAIVLPVTTVINNLCVAFLTKKFYPQYKCYGMVDKSELKEIRKNVCGLIFQKVGGIVLSSADSIVISAYLGLYTLGVYNGYYYVITALVSLLAGLQQGVIPSIGNSIITKTKEANYHDMQTYHFLYTWFIMWCSSCLLCLYQTFIRLWQGADNMLPFSMVILFSLFFYVHHMSDITFIYKEAMGLWWEGKFIPIISSALNLTLNIIFIQTIGLPGILLSTIISIALVNNIFGSGILFHYYYESNKQWCHYLVNLFFYLIKAAIALYLCWLVCSFISGQGILIIAIKLILCSVISNVVWVFLNLKNKYLRGATKLVLTLMPSALLKKFTSMQ